MATTTLIWHYETIMHVVEVGTLGEDVPAQPDCLAMH